MKVYRPTVDQPYKISSRKVTLRVACSAGINRSATAREYLKTIISSDSIIYPQYGIEFGDYDRKKIKCHVTKVDGFKELFGHDKLTSVHAKLFYRLGYKPKKNMTNKKPMVKTKLKDTDKDKYKSMLIDYYWKFDRIYDNVFVLINRKPKVIKLTIKRLKDLNIPVDLVILNLHDIIRFPKNKDIKPYSIESYKLFLDKVKKLIN